MEKSPSEQSLSAEQQQAKEELLLILDRGAAAMQQVVLAYAAARTWQRDVSWLALQAGKEYGAIVMHARRCLGPTPHGSCAELRKSLQDALEEAEHYEAYLELLTWRLEGKPCPIADMYEYCPPKAYALLGYGDYRQTRERWPHNYACFTERATLCDASSAWGAALIRACGEGGAVSWHWAQSQIPPSDEYSRRLVEIERGISADELHHGPETIHALLRDMPSRQEFDLVRERIKRVRLLELWQRNEQYLHPLSDEALRALEADFYAERLEPVALFRAAAL